MVSDGGNYPQTLDEDVLRLLSDDTHAGLAVYRHVAKHGVLCVLDKYRRARMERVPQVKLVSDKAFVGALKDETRAVIVDIGERSYSEILAEALPIGHIGAISGIDYIGIDGEVFGEVNEDLRRILVAVQRRPRNDPSFGVRLSHMVDRKTDDLNSGAVAHGHGLHETVDHKRHAVRDNAAAYVSAEIKSAVVAKIRLEHHFLRICAEFARYRVVHRLPRKRSGYHIFSRLDEKRHSGALSHIRKRCGKAFSVVRSFKLRKLYLVHVPYAP